MIVCLDTHLLIWGIRAEATPGQEGMIGLAQAFLNDLAQKKHKIIIPAPVLSEFLIGIKDPSLVEKTFKAFTKQFEIIPFDGLAANICAEIWHKKIKQEQHFDIRTCHKVCLKVDCQIVAIAISRKANVIYSYDKALKVFAEGRIAVEEIPQKTHTLDPILGEQISLFV